MYAGPTVLCVDAVWPEGGAGRHSYRFLDVYDRLAAPAVRKSDLEPLRADKEMTGGIIHKLMFERFVLSPYAVADLSLATANVYCQLGVRHAIRPSSTVLLFAEGSRLSFDMQDLRMIPYKLEGERLAPDHIEAAKNAIVRTPM
jgi:hypothetical protein